MPYALISCFHYTALPMSRLPIIEYITAYNAKRGGLADGGSHDSVLESEAKSSTFIPLSVKVSA